MPIISNFYGIIVRIFYSDYEQYNLPHIHIEYSEYDAVFTFDGKIIKGSLPKKQTKLVQAWIEIHIEELNCLWKLAKNNEQLFKIEPLK